MSDEEVTAYIVALVNAPVGVSVPVPEDIKAWQMKICLKLAGELRWLRTPGYALQADGIYAV
jgi:hypothetical protein